MLDSPSIVRTRRQLTAAIRLTIPRAEIRQVMEPARQELLAALTDQGTASSGPWLTHHFRMDPDIFDFELAVPVVSPVSAVGRVESSMLPPVMAARAVYHGGYEGLPQAWGEFEQWIARHGHQSAPDLQEHYVAGPEASPDPATWRTELIRPLIR